MYQRILVPLDGSATAERGLREAVALAADRKCRLTLLHVVNDFPMLVEMSSAVSFQETLSFLTRAGEEILAKAKAAATAAGVEADTLLREVRQGRVAEVIAEEAKKANCDLIVMGTHGRRGLSRMALGSDADLVVRTSPVPVLLVRQEETKA